MKNERLKKILQNNQRWAADKLSADPNYFKKLSKGQHPKLLYIGCSDSRATAEELMGLQPGEIFVHRNIANLVVGTDNNLNAVVQYAVEHLKVRHIIVCGHYDCGGVKAALYPKDLGQLNSWFQTLRDVFRLHQAELSRIRNPKKRFDRLVELNVREQCLNVIKIDHVQRSWYKTGFPKVHGWVFDVRTGLLKDLGLKLKELFSEIRAIYDLKIHETSND
jgi:carbonic anhydrase